MAGEAGHVRLERPIDSSSDKSVCAPKVAEKGPYTGAWVKVFRFIPEFRFLDLARHRFCETCKSGEILGGVGGGGGGGGGYTALYDENGRRLSRLLIISLNR